MLCSAVISALLSGMASSYSMNACSLQQGQLKNCSMVDSCVHDAVELCLQTCDFQAGSLEQSYFRGILLTTCFNLCVQSV